jgi:hypothetical protein
MTWRYGVIRTNIGRHSCLFLRNMGLQPFYGKWPHPLLSAGSRAARGKITISGIHNCQNYCEIFIVYKHFANVVTGHVIQPGGPQVRDPYCVSTDILRIVCLQISLSLSLSLSLEREREILCFLCRISTYSVFLRVFPYLLTSSSSYSLLSFQ